MKEKENAGNLEVVQRKRERDCGINSSHSGQGLVAGFCKHGNAVPNGNSLIRPYDKF